MMQRFKPFGGAQDNRLALSVLFVWVAAFCFCADASGAVRREINIPDIAGYKTLKCDFHMHTVFSDGEVWPTTRVEEAWREGLDVIAITDHIEYQPHKQDIPTKHNRPYEIAAVRAKEVGLLLVRGCEITRKIPPGHFNVIFTEDNNAFDLKDLMKVMKTAKEKDAFVFWNHPRWKIPDPNVSPWTDIHTELFKNGLFGGIEVVNRDVYYPEAHQWCLEKCLTMLGNSDMHPPAESLQGGNSNHRSMTLVFAKDRTLEAVKDALKNGRTAVWSRNILIGKREYLEPIFYASVKMSEARYGEKDSVRVTVKNSSDIEFTLKGIGQTAPSDVNLPANGSIILKTKKQEGSGKIILYYTATNLLTEPGQALPVKLVVDAP
jgi:hypothetical protein